MKQEEIKTEAVCNSREEKDRSIYRHGTYPGL